MSDLSRLRELAALFQPPKPVVEGAGSKVLSQIKADFEGKMDDLVDMFDRGGRVEQALGKVKDLDKDMQLVKDMAGVTADFKKKIMKLLDEADIMLSEDADPDPVNEGRRNHMDEMEYETIPGWKRALKQKHPEVWYHPDDGTIDAFVGPKPFKQGETKQVGYWDDTVGTING